MILKECMNCGDRYELTGTETGFCSTTCEEEYAKENDEEDDDDYRGNQ